MHFSSKMAGPLATYDIKSRIHGNRFSPYLFQNVSKEYAHKYYKR